MRRLPAVVRRTTPRLVFTFRLALDPPPDGHEPGPLDLSGGEVVLWAKRSPDPADPVVWSAVCQVDETRVHGKCWIRLTAVQTDQLGLLYLEPRITWTIGPRAGQVMSAGTWQLPIEGMLATS